MRIEPVARFREATFDLTPMIDVVLLLIIFFSMTSQFSEMQARPIDLPRERGEGEVQADAAMSVVVDLERDGTLHVMGRDYSRAELAALLRSQAAIYGTASRTPLQVVVRADRECTSDRLQDLARTMVDAGILHWRLATTGKPGDA